MKIGILTFHRAHNYGAVLQCYALQEVLKEMGHEVVVIDYRQQAIEKSNNKIKYGLIFNNKLSFALVKYFLYLLIKEPIATRKYNRFLIKYINVKHTCNYLDIPENFDYYVIGSDQLFNLEITDGLDPVYSGMFKRKKESKLIGYAVSANFESVEKISRSEWLCILNRFSAFSFRERRLSLFLLNKYKLNVDVCIDPTLLMDGSKWDKFNCSNCNFKSYVVLYEVRFKENKRNELKRKAHILAKRLDTKVINLSRMTYSVEEWVNYIKNARCVITSSFHASVFGLIFNRPIYSFILGDEGDSRYVDLFETIGANNCLKSINDDIEDLPQMDYELINKNLQVLREQSKSFLAKEIGNQEKTKLS